MTQEMTCIICPRGCRLTVTQTSGLPEVSGQACPRGEEYAREEISDPLRIVTTTVKFRGRIRRLPVRTDRPVSRSLIFEVMKIASTLEASPPVACKDILCKNIADSGADLIVTRTMPS